MFELCHIYMLYTWNINYITASNLLESTVRKFHDKHSFPYLNAIILVYLNSFKNIISTPNIMKILATVFL